MILVIDIHIFTYITIVGINLQFANHYSFKNTLHQFI